MSLLYFTSYAPDISTFTPVFVHTEKIAPPYTKGSMHKYNSDAYWWNACVVGNYISRFYNYAIIPIREIQSRLENQFYLTASLTETKVIELLNEKKNSGTQNEEIDQTILKLLTDYTVESGNTVNDEYKNIFPLLLARFRDGYEIDVNQVSVSIQPKFYPKWWLDKVNFFDSSTNSDGILFDPSPKTTKVSESVYGLLLIAILLATFIFGYRYRMNKKKNDYHVIMDSRTDSKLEMNKEKVYVNI